MNIHEAVEALRSSPDYPNHYRVLQKIVPQKQFNQVPEGADVRRAAVIDLETTGLDHKTEEIIQLSILVFSFDRNTGAIYNVLDAYTSYEEPSKPIPEDANAVNGITDEVVRGKSINDERVYSLLHDVDFVIAHNMKFDRKFFEMRFKKSPPLKWVCSFRDVPWRTELMGSGSLELLATKHCLFFDGHNAEIDAHALLAVLSKPTLKTGLMPMLELVKALTTTQFILYAFGAAIETKDSLKERGYRWDVERKVWNKYLKREECEAECKWLAEDVYRKQGVTTDVMIGYQKIDASSRHSIKPRDIEYARLAVA